MLILVMTATTSRALDAFDLGFDREHGTGAGTIKRRTRSRVGGLPSLDLGTANESFLAYGYEPWAHPYTALPAEKYIPRLLDLYS
jgi:hypothetical protein